MGSDYKVLVLPANAQTRSALSKAAQLSEHRGWLEVIGAEWKSDAQEFSKRFLTSAVWWSMQTPNDHVWLFCFHEGLEVRELRFSSELAGWSTNRGEGMPFEDTAALATWLRKWRSKKPPLTSRDGAALLNAFISKGPASTNPRPKPKPKPPQGKRARARAVK